MSKVALFLAILLVIVGAIYGISQSFKGSFKLGDIFSEIPGFSRKMSTSTKPVSPVKVTTQEAQRKAREAKKATTTVSKQTQEPKLPTPPQGFSQNDLSSVYGKVQITTVTKPSYASPRRGKFTLKAIGVKNESIDITGWRVKGNSGGEIYIPQASADYTLSGWMSNGDIIFGTGSYVTVYSTRSTVGRNIRLNKCFGYLNELYTFNPRLPNNCPSYDRKQISTFSGACQTFIRSLSACEVPTANEKNQFGGGADVACRALLDTFNYGGCYKVYRGNSDFFSGEWRVWIDAELPFDTEHDRLVLYDKSGKVVDVYTY